MDQDATWYGGTVGLGPSHIVLDGEPSPLQKRGTAPPQFSAHVCSGKTAGWIKMALGMELGFGSDGDPAPPKKGTATAPTFRSMFIVAKRLDGSRCHLVRR